MQYYKIQIDLKDMVSTDCDELVMKAYNDYASIGIEDLNLDEPSVDKLLGERSYCGGLIPEDIYEELEKLTNLSNSKIFYFDNQSNALKFIGFLDCNYNIRTKISAFKSNNDEWLAEWKKNFKPIHINNEINIHPNWIKHDLNFKYNLSINPGMGFGTGHHETTKMCLELALNIFKDNPTIVDIFDYGSGSGILGLLTAKINPNYNKIVLYDIDQDAIDNSINNASENKLLSSSLEITSNYDFTINQKKFELIFANILLDTLITCKENILSLSKTNTHLIVSGLLNNQVDEFVSHFSSDFNVLKRIELNDWSALHLVKN
jgi:ribosomal protein L11 methyltransferase